MPKVSPEKLAPGRHQLTECARSVLITAPLGETVAAIARRTGLKQGSMRALLVYEPELRQLRERYANLGMAGPIPAPARVPEPVLPGRPAQILGGYVCDDHGKRLRGWRIRANSAGQWLAWHPDTEEAVLVEMVKASK